MEILEVVADPESSALDLGKYIASDPSLSASVLKVVNSAYYGFYRQITSIPSAIVILGFNEVRNIALAATAFHVLGKGLSEFDRIQLWCHSSAAALAAEYTAGKLRIQAEGCFVVGLLHDIGKIALDTLYPGTYLQAADRANLEQRFIREVEREAFGMDHSECGALLAQHWDLPPDIVDAIRHHHDPGLSSEEPPLASLAALANYIAYQAGFGEISNGRSPDAPEYAITTLGLTGAQVIAACEHVESARERIEELIKSFGQ